MISARAGAGRVLPRPKTSAAPVPKSADQTGVSASPAAAQTQRSPRFTSVRYLARFTTTATLHMLDRSGGGAAHGGVTRADLCSVTTTPVAPAPSALRHTAPRLCGSVTWSRQARSGRSPATSSYASRICMARRARRRPGGRGWPRARSARPRARRARGGRSRREATSRKPAPARWRGARGSACARPG
jgi:hypothetical protein